MAKRYGAMRAPSVRKVVNALVSGPFISRSSTPHTNTHLATCTLRGRGERAARSKTSSDLTVRPGVRARVRARAGSERRERTSWGSRVCPDCTVCLSDARVNLRRGSRCR